LAKIIWNFDMELDASSRGWDDQNTYNLWEKGELNVHLKKRFPVPV